MLVVLAIIIVITAIIFAGQSGFNRTLALNNAAYDIALSVRQAQSYGLSSQAFSGTNNAGYGAYFQSGTPTSYLTFADTYPSVPSNSKPNVRPGDGYYDSSGELVQTYSLNNGFTISDFCVYVSGSGRTCTGSGGLTALSVTFARPNTQTTIMGKTSSWLGSSIASACVKLSSTSGDARYVSISQTGQVQVGSKSGLDPSDILCP